MRDAAIERARKFIEINQLKIDDPAILLLAMTHPSYAQEQGDSENNQRLEFLGDSVVDLVVARYLYLNYPDQPEGVLTKIRAKVVCERYLADFARSLGVGDCLILGRGEEKTGGRDRNSILADAMEAIIGALFLDQGLPYVEQFVLGQMISEIQLVADGGFSDFKSMLQELVQSTSRENVVYKIMEEKGPDHDRTFKAGVYYKSQLLASGEGKTKKEAEQMAAEIAFKDMAK